MKKKKSVLDKGLKIASITAILVSIFVNSTKITGHVVSSSNYKPFSILGTGLFILGLVGIYLTTKD